MNNITKKQYAKPELFYEDFALSQSIAGDCEGIAQLAWGLCSVHVKSPGVDMMIFQAGMKGCEYSGPDVDDMVCYHAPSEINNVFSS